MGERTMEMDVLLTEEELDEKRRLLPLRVVDVRETREAFKALSKQWSDRIKGHERDAFKLADCIKTGKERREVPIYERTNETLFRIETVREDTGEIVDVRAMEVHEMERARQPGLPFPGADNDDDDDQRTETETLPRHEPLDTIHAPPLTMVCPGPAGGEGCTGHDCSRCAGNCVVPTVAAAADDDESEPDVAEHEDEPGTAIESPEAVLNAAATTASVSSRKHH